MHVLDARITTSFVACSRSYLRRPALFLSFLEHHPSLRAGAASSLIPSIAGAPSFNHPLTKTDYCSVSPLSGTATFPKTAKLTINNTLTTPQPLVANTGTRS
jgi:hypothetical protein